MKGEDSCNLCRGFCVSKSNSTGPPKALWKKDSEGCRVIPFDHDWGDLEGGGDL